MEMGFPQGPTNPSGVVVPLLSFVGGWSVVRPVSPLKSVLRSLEQAPVTDGCCVLPSEGWCLCTLCASELQ